MDYTRNWLKRNPENFPVASWLLPAAGRPALLAFYGFARGADEIADDRHRSASARRQALEQLESALLRRDEAALPDFARPLARMLPAHPALLGFARDLLSAFVQDTVKSRYHDMTELLDYCQRSAVPVGRALLAIYKEDGADLAAADGLCTALQLLNHLQDCSDDYVNRDRVYLPLDWFAQAGAEATMLAAGESTRELRRVQLRLLDHADRLLARAQKLAPSLAVPGVRREAAWILALAKRLSAKLRVRDPLAGKVRVSPPAMLASLIAALVSA